MANEYLKRTPTSTGNRKVFTFSVWYKRLSDNGATSSRYFFLAGDTHINLRGSGASNPDTFVTNQRSAGTNYFYHYAPARRDYSSWQHLLYAVDTTQSIEKNRGRVYINGVEQLESSSIGSSNALQNDDLSINKTVAHLISEDGGDDGTYPSSLQLFDAFLIDGQALAPDVFGFYKDGDGYISAGSTKSTDFRPGQWSPRAPKSIKYTINRSGGFGVNGFYLPMNDSSNPGADFHCAPNSIIKLKGEDLPQPQNGAPITSDAFVSQLRQETGTLGFDGAVKFDGDGDYLSFADNNDWDIGTGAFTVECFVNINSSSTDYSGIFGMHTGSVQFQWRINAQGRLQFLQDFGGTRGNTDDGSISGTNLRDNSWHHVALTRQSDYSWQLYVDGKVNYSGTGMTGNITNINEVAIGRRADNNSNYLTGFISNLRFINGTALYTTDFTPPTEPLTAVTNTKLLCCNSSTSATAATVTPGTITANGDVFATKNELTGSLILACPFVAGGFGQNGAANSTIPGLGDYHIALGGPSSVPAVNWLIASGTQATITGDKGLYYGSSLDVTTSSINPRATVGTAFTPDGDYTVEFWVYINSFNSGGSHVIQYDNDAGATGWLVSVDAGTLRWMLRNSSNQDVQVNIPNTVKSEQWNHIAGVYDSSKNLMTGYVNGVAVGSTPVASNYLSTQYTNLNRIHIGSNGGTGSRPMEGYMSDLRIYKGLAKYKGGFDVPKPYTPVGIESWRTTADTCKNNFATLNPLFSLTSNNTYTNGNLKAVANSNDQVTTGNMAFSSGKWYWETRIFNDEMTGLAIPSQHILGYPGANTNAFSYHQSGNVYHNGTTSYGVGWPGSTYRIIGFAVDWTNRRAYWSIDGVWHNSADPSAGTGFYNITVNAPNVAASVDAVPAWRSKSASPSEQVSVNFGQNPSFGGELTAGTNADDSGKGLFKYAPPTGFLALCEDNLPAPAIADPGEHFKCVLYTGSGGSKAITGVGFKPDLVWVKSRTNTEGHILFDSVRGPNVRQLVHTSTVEGTATGAVNSFDDDGFSTGVYTGTNQSGQDYVAWCWKAGGAAVANTDGTIASQVSVNQTAGFSCGTFTGNLQANQSIGHGLGKVPAMVVVKERNANSGWAVYHKSRGNTKVSYWDIPNTEFTETNSSASWGPTDPTSDVFYVGANGATNDNNLAFYAWAEIENYSKFGSYVGNSADDGPVIWCGFKPAFLMIKLVTGSERDWHIYDSSRNPTNPVGLNLRPSGDNVENDEPGIDFLSNGFKIRKNYVFSNESGQTIIFMAFAESPFQTANAK